MPGVTPQSFKTLDEIAPELRKRAVQAPAEYGGEYWLLTPWSGREPWLKLYVPKPEVTLPAGFKEIFGEKPNRTQPQYADVSAAVLRDAQAEWDVQLKVFVQAGEPPWYAAMPLDNKAQAFAVLVDYGLDPSLFFENIYGWRIIWPKGPLPTRSEPAYEAMTNPHFVIAQYQIDMLLLGIMPKKISQIVPPFWYSAA